MLLAEIHGKSVAEARDAEDYLTSAVFGHLRYVPPAVFWPELFAAARTTDDRPLSDFLPDGATHLDVEFWPQTPEGEPDLLLTLGWPDGRTVRLVIEVKLWAGKSGAGEHDQLIRYLRGVPDAFLIYLTPRDPAAEIADSLRAPIARPDDERRLFGLRWQTLHDIARHTAAITPLQPAKLILANVAKFLDRMGLTGFDGWHEVLGEGGLTPMPAAWVTLFRELAELGELVPTRAVWVIPFCTVDGLDADFPTPARWTHAP